MTASRILIAGLACAGLLLLAACGSGSSGEPEVGTDKSGLALALAAPMMVDADLATRNQAEAAISGGGPPVIVLPPFVQTDEMVAAAKAEAEKLSGGSIPAAPMADGEPDPVLRDGVAAAQRAAAIKGPGKVCGASADYALAWSLQLPPALPIYPRGNLQEAAGSNIDGCRLRSVRFVSPVEPSAIVDFYHARVRAAGFAVRYRADKETHQLSGSKGQAEFAVQVRKREDGLTEADIVVNGF